MDQSIFYGKEKAARNEKKATRVFIFQKNGKYFWNIFLVYFIKDKPLIFEECKQGLLGVTK